MQGYSPQQPTAWLDTATWTQRAHAHRQRAEAHTLPARHRRERQIPHPTADFLFEYYPFPFSLLENWLPPAGITLEWPDPGMPFPPGFSPKRFTTANGGLSANPHGLTPAERQRLAWTIHLLESTAANPPNFACHGLHEWAMVYRGTAVRHAHSLPLRLAQAEIDALVESRPIRCSHFDAFRFFHADARPLNQLQPSLDTRSHHEQPACLHANMDLYKWCAKSMPWTGADLLLDCFELATALRELDMRASPYDLTSYGQSPVRIETPQGRKTYEQIQRSLADRARTLRERLITALRTTLDLADHGGFPA